MWVPEWVALVVLTQTDSAFSPYLLLLKPCSIPASTDMAKW